MESIRRIRDDGSFHDLPASFMRAGRARSRAGRLTIDNPHLDLIHERADLHRHARSFAKVCAIVMHCWWPSGRLPSTALAGRTVTVPISVALSTDYQWDFRPSS